MEIYRRWYMYKSVLQISSSIADVTTHQWFYYFSYDSHWTVCHWRCEVYRFLDFDIELADGARGHCISCNHVVGATIRKPTTRTRNESYWGHVHYGEYISKDISQFFSVFRDNVLWHFLSSVNYQDDQGPMAMNVILIGILCSFDEGGLNFWSERDSSLNSISHLDRRLNFDLEITS